MLEAQITCVDALASTTPTRSRSPTQEPRPTNRSGRGGEAYDAIAPTRTGRRESPSARSRRSIPSAQTTRKVAVGLDVARSFVFSGIGHWISPAFQPTGKFHLISVGRPASPGNFQYMCQPGAI